MRTDEQILEQMLAQRSSIGPEVPISEEVFDHYDAPTRMLARSTYADGETFDWPVVGFVMIKLTWEDGTTNFILEPLLATGEFLEELELFSHLQSDQEEASRWEIVNA